MIYVKLLVMLLPGSFCIGWSIVFGWWLWKWLSEYDWSSLTTIEFAFGAMGVPILLSASALGIVGFFYLMSQAWKSWE